MLNSDNILGKTAVKLGWLNETQLSFCLQKQQQYQAAGQTISLAQLMVELQYISAQQLQSFISNPSLGRYKILQELGRGGMGCVYKAYDPKLQRVVAIKVLLKTGKEAETKRFLREAKTTAQLKHPNIVNVYDFGIENQQYFFTMDFIEGISLHDLVDTKLSTKQIVHYMLKITDAIHYAHQQGIIHRDLKPANIIINPKNEPIVMDFGLAKINNASQQLSKSGMIMGTLLYMAPEQVDGKVHEIDARTDVYALGAILYELLTLHVPFSGSNTSAVMEKILNKPPVKPSNYKNSISPELEKVCLKALEKNKSKRYQSVEELHEDLQRFSERKKVYASQPSYTKKLHTVLIPVAIVILIIAITFFYFLPQKKVQFDDLLQINFPKIQKTSFEVEATTQEVVIEGSNTQKHDILKILINDQLLDWNSIKFSYKTSLQYGKNKIHFFILYNGNKWLEHTWMIHRQQPKFVHENLVFRNNLQKTGFFDSKTVPQCGKIIWKQHFSKRFWSSPLVTSSHIFIGCYDHNFYCLDRYDGKIVWKFATRSHITSTPAIYNGNIYLCSTDSTLYVINMQDGSLVWSAPVPGIIEASPIVANDHLYVGTTNGIFQAIDLKTRQNKWIYPVRFNIVASPALYKSTLCFGALNGNLYLLDSKSGAAQVIIPTRGSIYASPSISEDGIVYFGNRQGNFYAYDIENSKILWQKRVGTDIVASPAINQNFVYCASNMGVYCLVRETGQVKWYIKTPRIVETSLALTHKAIFFGDFLGNFYIAETSQGNIIEKLSTNASMTSSPFVKENIVFFANYSGDLYAVKFSE